MVSEATVRRFALSLPEASERDHHGMTSYRVRGKVFATVPDREHVRIMVDEPEMLAAVSEDPETYEAFFWGKRLACVVVKLGSAHPDRVRELLGEAWLRKAPRALAGTFDPSARPSSSRPRPDEKSPTTGATRAPKARSAIANPTVE